MSRVGAMFVAAAMVGCLVGCSSRPSVGEVRKQVLASIAPEGLDAYLVVENFRKTNGYVREDGLYVVEVAYDLVFKRSFQEIADKARREAEQADSLLTVFGQGFGVLALRVRYGEFPAGHRVRETGEFAFRKTEKGWRLVQK